MYWGWKSGQEPDGPAFERNPSELPKTHFVEKGREHSSWYSFWGPEHEYGIGRHPCDKSLTPWSGPGWANHPSSWVHECPETRKGPEQHPCTLWTSSVPKARTLYCKPSLQKRTEGTSWIWKQASFRSTVTNQSPSRIGRPSLAQENNAWKSLVPGPIEGLPLLPRWEQFLL